MTTSRTPARDGGGRFWRPDQPWYRQPLVAILLVPGVLLLGVAALVFVYLFAAIPLPGDIAPAATILLDRNGDEIGTLQPEAGRHVPLEELPDHVKEAVLAAEDRGFYGHFGISVRGTLRALVTNVRAGEIEQGGSTITQQYIKNAELSPERTFTRKAKEAILALKLERQYSKDEILEFYLNTIYWGRGTFGIESAALTYFSVPAKDLTVNQAAMLAGMIRAPERINPRKDPGAVDIRREYVLDGMVEHGWLAAEEARSVLAEGLPETSGRERVALGPQAYYVDAVRDALADQLGDEFVYRGLTVHTELDMRMQIAAHDVLTQRLADLRQSLRDDPPSERFDASRVSGAIVSVDPEDGGVRALVGGPNFARQPFNAAIDGGNQTGSAFKPFGLAAFTDEGFSPESRFPAPAKLENVEFPNGQVYEEVNNFGGSSYGEQSVRQATLTSTNTVYVQMAAEIGSDRVLDLARDAGIPEDAMAPDPSLVLGTSDVRVVDMANAYATFASGGVRNLFRLVREVRDADGRVVLERQPESEGAINSNVAYVVSDLLEQNIQSGTGTRAQIGRPAAGKTGTTQDSKDAWFVGYVPQLSTAVWFGHLDDDSMGNITGGSYPAEAWGEYMLRATEGMEPIGFPEPDLAGLRTLNEEPTPTPTPSPSPTETTTECPDGEGGFFETILPPESPCPSPSPEESPSESESPSPILPPPPEESPSPDDDESSPSPSPSPSG